MGLILDSSAVIAAERKGLTAYQMVKSLGAVEMEVAASVVTVLEIAHGVARADSESRRAARQGFLNDLLSGMPAHPVTIQMALRAGRIAGLLQSRGLHVALAQGYAAATHNVRHFGMIPDLTVRPL